MSQKILVDTNGNILANTNGAFLANEGVESLGGATGVITLGSGLSISNNELSADGGSSYTAGDGIQIDNNEISVDSTIARVSDVPAAQIQSDWNQSNTEASDYIKNKPTIFSGSYTDLTDKPTLGTAAAKDYSTTVAEGDTNVITGGAVYTAISELPEPMVFKGTVGTNGTKTWDNFPSSTKSNLGHVYVAITAHATTPICEVGDILISNGTSWTVVPSGDEPAGTVTNVAAEAASGSNLTVSGSPITSSGTLIIGVASGYSIPSTAAQTTWSGKQNKVEVLDLFR